ncbi:MULTISPECIES: hypothetical protein [Stenotrophomonas]|uniref:hypothetical protein n=1 Tax=Stenotrophomonas TaxID=40323 RepID=UPI00087294BE|nr:MULTISPECIES: hypothetical protein [Stenotrophomonas]OEZ02436.1 hypothetical protein BIY45_01140 [Stenotrophomonas sp. BIIR7]
MHRQVNRGDVDDGLTGQLRCYHALAITCSFTMDLSNLHLIQERIRGIEGQLELTLAHLKALEVSLRLSIATHTDPTSLLAALDIFEEGTDGHGPAGLSEYSAGYRRAFSDGIASVRKEVLLFQKRRSE